MAANKKNHGHGFVTGASSAITITDGSRAIGHWAGISPQAV
jgi:thiamine phosphate synthase YjbQ (UPF0047 family)